MRAYLAVAVMLVSLWVLERARQDVAIRDFHVGQIPVTEYARADATGPVVVVAHGFAGSQQMMQGYALPLARAGYRVFAFEFLGHGRHPVPMSGDVTAIDGTTRLLVDQTARVINGVAGGDGPVALLGHSMATDVLARIAAERTDIGPVVLISAFSRVIDATTPRTLLLIAGAWEPGLRGFAEDALKMLAPDAVLGQTATDGAVTRRAMAAPFSEHVSVLHARAGRAEAVDWLDRAYGRASDVTILPSGWAILGLLGGVVLMFRSVASLMPVWAHPPARLSRGQLAVALLMPVVAAPLIAVPLDPGFLPVLVADYLGLHLFVFGMIQLALLRLWGVAFGRVSPMAVAVLLIGCALFGVGLNRYAANFWPTSQRWWIIGVMMIGAVPYMVSDAVLTHGTSVIRRIAVRAGFLASLGIAVALDFKSLFFLIMIAPVLVLFYLVFGTMGRNMSDRVGPLSSGLALGMVLAWALGVSFPLFR